MESRGERREENKRGERAAKKGRVRKRDIMSPNKTSSERHICRQNKSCFRER